MVALLVPCLVDQLYPEVGEAVVEVLERAGETVEWPRGQTCCGLPLFNAGHWHQAARPARHVLDVFEGQTAVVVPSSSCAAMLRRCLPRLLEEVPSERERAEALGARTHELTSYLVRVLGRTDLGARYEGRVACHRSCHLRELDAEDEAETLVRAVHGARLVELDRPDACCGFGGTFSVKYPALSEEMGRARCRAFDACGADLVVTTDAGCMLQLDGVLHRDGSRRRIRHIAELLANRIEGVAAP